MTPELGRVTAQLLGIHVTSVRSPSVLQLNFPDGVKPELHVGVQDSPGFNVCPQFPIVPLTGADGSQGVTGTEGQLLLQLRVVAVQSLFRSPSYSTLPPPFPTTPTTGLVPQSVL